MAQAVRFNGVIQDIPVEWLRRMQPSPVNFEPPPPFCEKMIRLRRCAPCASCAPSPFRHNHRTSNFLKIGAVTLLFAVSHSFGHAADQAAEWKNILPTLKGTCFECHGNGKSKGGVDLQRLESDPSFSAEFELWKKVQISVQSGEMPPDDAKKPLPSAERSALEHWVAENLLRTAMANAGDPGHVTLRRLNNAEYDYSVRDLTGIDFQISKEFTPDGGGGEGFNNLGDVLFVNPQHLNAYFGAARKIADHASIHPGTGVEFHPIRLGVRGPSQLKAGTEAVLYRWYQERSLPSLPKDGEDLREAEYMLAAWQWKHRQQTGVASLSALAKEKSLFLPFLENWITALDATEPKSRFLDLTRVAWRNLAPPEANAPQSVPESVTKAIAKIQKDQRSWLMPAGWPVQRAQQDADGLRPYPAETSVNGAKSAHLVVGDTGDGARGDWVFIESLELQIKGKNTPYFDWLKARLQTDQENAMLDDAALQAKGLQRPDVVQRISEAEQLVSKLGVHPLGLKLDPKAMVLQAPCVLNLPLPNETQKVRFKGRLDLQNPEAEFATAQWMITTETPPDPAKIIPGVLTVWKRQTEAQGKTMADFDVMRRVFPDSLERRLEQVARNLHTGGKGPGVYYLSDTQLRSIIPSGDAERLDALLTDWRFVKAPINKAQQQEWDSAALKSLFQFAWRAWRRPVTDQEKTDLTAVYESGIAAALDRESAGREVLVRILVAPEFLFKLEQNQGAPVHPVNAWELASRLSYLMWSSVPDESLLKLASGEELLKPERLAAEAKRMLHDPKAKSLAREFAAQWLEFHHFDAHSKVDENKFPEFTPELRNAFYEEAAAFFDYVIRDNRPLREILSANYTFLNKRLAEFYGIPGVDGDEFSRVDVSAHSRGGLLGMGAVLTKTSYPHRTSPVLRGNWLLQNVLGSPTPPPPNNVPKLDENVAAAKTLRARLEMHRQDKACASCHDKIDPLGFALESFDAIGRLRAVDEAGSPVDDSAKTKDGTTFKGPSGLREHLKKRESEFFAVFCRKLAGYALGRTIQPSDQPLLDRMRERIQREDGTFESALVLLVQSKQFTHRRNE